MNEKGLLTQQKRWSADVPYCVPNTCPFEGEKNRVTIDPSQNKTYTVSKLDSNAMLIDLMRWIPCISLRKYDFSWAFTKTIFMNSKILTYRNTTKVLFWKWVANLYLRLTQFFINTNLQLSCSYPYPEKIWLLKSFILEAF